MVKLRSMIEDVAEKLFGRFLPQIEAQASCSGWEPDGCCPVDKWQFKQYCFPHPPGCPGGWCYSCTGVCPA